MTAKQKDLGAFKSLDALEEAVRKQASNLDPAQEEFVLAEFEIYKWNAAKIEKLQDRLEAGADSLDDDGKLFRQRHQLVAEQSTLFAHIMRWLKGTASEESALDEFLSQ